MKTFSAFLAAIILRFCISAQQSNSSDSAASSKSGPASYVETKPRETGGKVEVPPEKKRPITIPKISTPPVIDGKIDEEIWKQAAVFKDFYQTGPGYNTPPSRPTEVYMVYDEKNLYVAF